MALINYAKMGSLTLHQRKNKFELSIYQCNALASFCYDYVEDGKKMQSLYTFLADEQHAKNIVKNCGSLFGDKVDHIRINIAYKEGEKLAKLLAKNGYEVTVFYEPIKSK